MSKYLIKYLKKNQLLKYSPDFQTSLEKIIFSIKNIVVLS